MSELGYQMVDLDQHYYEEVDAFTRYQDPKIARSGRGVQLIQQEGRTYFLVGGKLLKFIPNPTFSHVAPPGSLEAYFRGEAGGQRPAELVSAEKLRPEYVSREPRLEALRRLGVEEALMLPTLAVGVEEAFCDDIEALHATMHAFNRWLLETWSFQGPTVGAPLLSFADVDKALAELEWLLSEGARVINVCPGPVRGVGDVRHSPAHRRYDPIWQRINDAGVAIAYHAADTGYFRYFKDYDDPADYNAFSNQIRLGSLWSHDRPMQDMLAVMVMQRLFDRFPNLRIVSVEQGSSWLPVILKKLEKSYRQRPSLYAEDPTETIRRHLWMCPFWEDDIPQLVGLIGADRVVLGSDWPHPEGVEEPAQFAKYLDGLGDEQVEMVMRTNGRRLMTPAPIA